MSYEDMSIFNRLEAESTDEVTTATEELQDLQINDQSTLDSSHHDSSSPNQIHFSLIDDGPLLTYQNEEELNSDTSPQHQLYDGHLIEPLARASSNPHKSENGKKEADKTPIDNTRQPISKSMLLSKFKESIKLKNSQIKALKDELKEVDQYKAYSDKLKNELEELRKTHETWTVSIAENKLAVHQEIELRNVEIESLRKEISDLQSNILDSNTQIGQLKARIQDLESKLIRMSAAHQKERDTLTRELTISKNNAIKQVQRDHEINMERVKLDLEKSIEALKMGMLTKDQQLVESSKQNELLIAQNQDLQRNIDQCNITINHHKQELEDFKRHHDKEVKLSIDSATMTDILEDSSKKDVEFEYLKNIGE